MQGAQWLTFEENEMAFKCLWSVCAALAFSNAVAATDPVYQQVCSVCHAAGVAGAATLYSALSYRAMMR